MNLNTKLTMTKFSKLLFFTSLSFSIIFLFSGMIFPKPQKTINQEELIEYVLQEYTYEITYGNPHVDLDSFIDQAIIQKLKESQN